MRKALVAIVVLLSVTSLVSAVEMAGQDVAVTVDATYVSKYIWRGFDLQDDKAAFQPSVDMDFGNGFSFNVWMNIPGSSKGNASTSLVDATEMDYTLAYSNSTDLAGIKTDYTVGWTYFDYTDVDTKDADAQEVFVALSMPEVLGECGVVPSYTLYQMWDSSEGGSNAGISGAIHVLGLAYDMTFESMPELPLTLTCDTVFNDGAGKAGGLDSDLSHTVYGVATSMTCPWTGGTLTPAVYYQQTYEADVNEEDEFWAGVSYSYTF